MKHKRRLINGGFTILAVLAVSMAVAKVPNKNIQQDKPAQTKNGSNNSAVKPDLKLVSSVPQKTIRQGDSGTEVRNLQEILLRAPDLFPDGSVTGSFGTSTENAVKKFQVKNHLEITGSVDAATSTKLKQFDARTAQYQQLKLNSVEVNSRTLKLTGTGFTADGNSIEAKGRVIVTDLASADGTTLSFTLPLFVPCDVGSSCPIKVVNYNGISNAVPFKLSSLPSLTPSPSPTPTPTPTPTPSPSPTPQPSPAPSPCQYAAATPAPVPPVSFKLLSPNGGENWSFGSSHPITWEGADPSWPVCISLINAAKTQVLKYLAFDLANDGSENWIADVPPGEYIMYVEACRGCPNMVWDYSDSKFTVSSGPTYGKISSAYTTNKSLVLLSPKSPGEVWSAGSSYDILWSGGEAGWTVSIGLIDRTTNSIAATLFSGIPNSGKTTWNMSSSMTASQYGLYISCSNCPAGTFGNYAYSFNNFTVLSP